MEDSRIRDSTPHVVHERRWPGPPSVRVIANFSPNDQGCVAGPPEHLHGQLLPRLEAYVTPQHRGFQGHKSPMGADVGYGSDPFYGWMCGICRGDEEEDLCEDFWREFEYCCQGVPSDFQLANGEVEAVDFLVDFSERLVDALLDVRRVYHTANSSVNSYACSESV